MSLFTLSRYARVLKEVSHMKIGSRSPCPFCVYICMGDDAFQIGRSTIGVYVGPYETISSHLHLSWYCVEQDLLARKLHLMLTSHVISLEDQRKKRTGRDKIRRVTSFTNSSGCIPGWLTCTELRHSKILKKSVVCWNRNLIWSMFVMWMVGCHST